jgi:RalA-binding protein 1
LKERFNNEHDVNLLIIDEDIHAVAGLLKAYLRDLPSHILTKELRSDFVNVVELEGEDRFATLRVLLDELPIENLTLIRYLYVIFAFFAPLCIRHFTIRRLHAFAHLRSLKLIMMRTQQVPLLELDRSELR